ncbi:MAG: hypothetical protein R3F54_28875 [Alphaproteobacteria bacterium]
METLREIQMAGALGYTEIDDFRRDLKAGIIPKPVSYLAPKNKRPIWLRDQVEEWLGVTKADRDRQDFLALVDQVA